MIYFQGKRIFSAIFDMDGTMFDTERLRFKTLKQAAEEIYGTPLSEATLIGSLGLSAKKPRRWPGPITAKTSPMPRCVGAPMSWNWPTSAITACRSRTACSKYWSVCASTA